MDTDKGRCFCLYVYEIIKIYKNAYRKDNSDMKKILCKLKEHILLDTIFYILFIIIVYFILKLFNMRYRNWIYYISYALIIIGTIAGIIQLYRRKGKTFKKSIIVLTFIVVLIILVFWKYILFVLD